MLLFLEQLHPMSSVKSKSALVQNDLWPSLAHMAPARRAGAVSVLSGLPGACGSAKSIWEAKTLACPHRSKSNLPFSENSKWLLQHDCKIKINKANNVANCKKNMYCIYQVAEVVSSICTFASPPAEVQSLEAVVRLTICKDLATGRNWHLQRNSPLCQQTLTGWPNAWQRFDAGRRLVVLEFAWEKVVDG